MRAADVTVVVCTIPPRAGVLARALTSILAQTVTPAAVHISYDHERGGHAFNRNQALANVDTPWVAFLDDDDEWDQNHLETLCNAANHSGADLIYPWHRIKNAQGEDVPDLLKGGMKPFDAEELRRNNYIPVTVLARTRHLRLGFPVPKAGEPFHRCEDWGLWLKMLDAGAVFHHVPQVTWTWHHWGGNTQGQGDRW